MTVPAKSMPGTSGQRRTTGALPVIASPSLYFTVVASTATVTSPSIRSASVRSVTATDCFLSASRETRMALKVSDIFYSARLLGVLDCAAAAAWGQSLEGLALEGLA